MLPVCLQLGLSCVHNVRSSGAIEGTVGIDQSPCRQSVPGVSMEKGRKRKILLALVWQAIEFFNLTIV